MCGIAFATSLYLLPPSDHADAPPVNSVIDILYQHQRDRGTDGFGFVTAAPGQTARRFRSPSEKAIAALLAANPSPAILFHHRFPTSTANTEETAQPIRIVRPEDARNPERTYYFAHNGVIHNAYKLRKKHRKQNRDYETEGGGTFNDSESLAHEIVDVVRGERDQPRAVGSVAFVMLECDRLNRPLAVYYGRNSANPLNLYESDNHTLAISSEGPGYEVRANVLHRLNLATSEIVELRTLNLQTWAYHGKETPYFAAEPVDPATDDPDDLPPDPELTQSALAGYSVEELETELQIAEDNGDEETAAIISDEIDFRLEYYASRYAQKP